LADLARDLVRARARRARDAEDRARRGERQLELLADAARTKKNARRHVGRDDGHGIVYLQRAVSSTWWLVVSANSSCPEATKTAPTFYVPSGTFRRCPRSHTSGAPFLLTTLKSSSARSRSSGSSLSRIAPA